MSTEHEYEIVLHPEPEGGFSVLVPELPNVVTQGETIEEATDMAKDGLPPLRTTAQGLTFPSSDS